MFRKIATTCLALVIGASVYAACPADWDGAQTYEAGNQVTYSNNVYTADRAVPFGTSPADGYFWTAIASCQNGNITYEADLQVGSYQTPSDLMVHGDVKVGSGKFSIGNNPSQSLEATQNNLTLLSEAAGGGSKSTVGTGEVVVSDWWLGMSSSTTTVKPAKIVVESASRGGSGKTEITSGAVTTPKLVINGMDVKSFLDQQQATINDLTARIEALEIK